MTWPVEQLTHELSRRLSALEPPQNAAFSASCAERLMQLYQDFCGEQSWDGSSNCARFCMTCGRHFATRRQVTRLEKAIPRLEQLVPHADDFNSALITAAQDCAICTDIAVRWLLGRGLRFLRVLAMRWRGSLALKRQEELAI